MTPYATPATHRVETMQILIIYSAHELEQLLTQNLFFAELFCILTESRGLKKK